MIDLFSAFSSGIEWVVRVILDGLVQGVAVVFSIGIESYLFFENPVRLDGLRSVQQLSVIVFAAVLALGLFQHLLAIMLFPYGKSGNFQRLIERGTLASIVVVVSGPALGFCVAFVNALAGAFYRTPFDLTWGSSILDRLLSSTGPFVGVPLALFCTAALLVFGLGVLFVFVVRMFAVYLLYCLLPLLVAFWTFDVGPLARAREFAEMAFRATAYLLLYGPIAAACLWIGATVGGFTETAAAEGSFADGPATATATAQLAGESTSLAAALGDLFMFLAAIGSILAVGVTGALSILQQ